MRRSLGFIVELRRDATTLPLILLPNLTCLAHWQIGSGGCGGAVEPHGPQDSLNFLTFYLSSIVGRSS